MPSKIAKAMVPMKKVKVQKERRPRFWPASAVTLRRKQGGEAAARCGGGGENLSF